MKLKNSVLANYSIGGGIASSFAYNMMMVYFLVFSTDIMGISGSAVGVIMLISRLVDTFTDPLMGTIADRTATKWGRYRFWLLVSAPFLFISTYLVFASPNLLNQQSKFVYMLVMYVAFSIVYTVPNIAFHSLSSYLTDDTRERQKIVLSKQSVGQIAAFLVNEGGFYIITRFGGGESGYRAMGFVFAIIITIGYILCAQGVKSIDTKERSYELKSKMSKKDGVSIWKSMTYIVKMPSMLALSIASSTNTFALAVTGAIGLYFYTHVMKNAAYFATASLVNTIAIALGYVVTFLLIKKYSNKNIFLYSSILAIIPSVVLYYFFYDNPTWIIGMLALSYGITQVAFLATWMMVTDCADDIRYLTGESGDGIASAGLNFSNKLGLALGGLFAGVFISKIGYEPNALSQSAEAIKGLIFAMTMLPAIGNVFSVIAMKWYPINEEYHKNILSVIASRDEVEECNNN